MATFLKAGDVISGQEGTATMNVDGVITNMFFVRNLEATFEKNKTEINTLGHRGGQHKTTGWSGSGSMNIFYITSVFRNLALDYAKNGKDVYFDVTIVNEDPTSTVGKQTVVLYNCNLDSVPVAKLDVENTELDEDLDFTFEDFEILDTFKTPELGVRTYGG